MNFYFCSLDTILMYAARPAKYIRWPIMAKLRWKIANEENQ